MSKSRRKNWADHETEKLLDILIELKVKGDTPVWSVVANTLNTFIEGSRSRLQVKYHVQELSKKFKAWIALLKLAGMAKDPFSGVPELSNEEWTAYKSNYKVGAIFQKQPLKFEEKMYQYYGGTKAGQHNFSPAMASQNLSLSKGVEKMAIKFEGYGDSEHAIDANSGETAPSYGAEESRSPSKVATKSPSPSKVATTSFHEMLIEKIKAELESPKPPKSIHRLCTEKMLTIPEAVKQGNMWMYKMLELIKNKGEQDWFLSLITPGIAWCYLQDLYGSPLG